VALLELSKFFELDGDIESARKVLNKCLSVASGEWKVWFEAVTMEIRNGYFKEAACCL